MLCHVSFKRNTTIIYIYLHNIRSIYYCAKTIGGKILTIYYLQQGVRICYRTVSVPFFRLTVRSAKRTEPLIVTVRFLVFDREPYRTKMETVIRLLLRTAIHVIVPYRVSYREPYRTKTGAVRFAVPQHNWYGVQINVVNLYGTVRSASNSSRSNTKMRTVKINGSVRFALPTVRLKNGTVTVAIVEKTVTVKKTENGTDTVTNSDPLLSVNIYYQGWNGMMKLD